MVCQLPKHHSARLGTHHTTTAPDRFSVNESRPKSPISRSCCISPHSPTAEYQASAGALSMIDDAALCASGLLSLPNELLSITLSFLPFTARRSVSLSCSRFRPWYIQYVQGRRLLDLLEKHRQTSSYKDRDEVLVEIITALLSYGFQTLPFEGPHPRVRVDD